MRSIAPLDHRQVDLGAGDVTRAISLSAIDGIRHGITGRLPTASQGEGNVGFGPPRDKDAAWTTRRRWCEAIGLDAEAIVTLGQVHGADVVRVGRGDRGCGARPGSPQVGLGDAMITDEPGVVLMTLHADCLPILLLDPVRPAVAAIHAGWRGTTADVTASTVRAMAAAFGSTPESLLAYAGPAIGPCCYEVGQDVADAWARATGEAAARGALRRSGDRWRFDLWQANRAMLVRAGLCLSNIELNETCTRCAGEHWFSHRGQGPNTGRFGAIIALVDRRPESFARPHGPR